MLYDRGFENLFLILNGEHESKLALEAAVVGVVDQPRKRGHK